MTNYNKIQINENDIEKIKNDSESVLKAFYRFLDLPEDYKMIYPTKIKIESDLSEEFINAEMKLAKKLGYGEDTRISVGILWINKGPGSHQGKRNEIILQEKFYE